MKNISRKIKNKEGTMSDVQFELILYKDELTWIQTSGECVDTLYKDTGSELLDCMNTEMSSTTGLNVNVTTIINIHEKLLFSKKKDKLD